MPDDLTPRYRFNPDAEFTMERVRKTISPAEEYEDRTGYDPDFLGPDVQVLLPRLGDPVRGDAASFVWKGEQTQVLDYMHFSTVMSMSRRTMTPMAALPTSSESPMPVRRWGSWRSC